MTENEELKIRQEFESHTMSEESIAEFIEWEKGKGLSEKMLRQLKGPVSALYRWLPEDKQVNKALLGLWREDMNSRNLSKESITTYIKSVNRYLDYHGCSHMRFNRGRGHDLTNMRFGYLTALEPTEERNRKDIVWLCRCSCGNLCKVSATSLVSANTLSCGCLKAEHIKAVGKFIDNTSLRAALEDRVKSERAISGYTGVSPKRGLWRAQIKYKGQNYYLGSFTKLEDAVRARSAAKQLVMEDAANLLEVYEELHKDDVKPARTPMQKQPAAEERKAEGKARRNDNKSGYTGVFLRRGKWTAKITYQKKSYILGSFEALEDAVSAREKAEALLKADPQRFLEEYAEKFAVYDNRERGKEHGV